MATEQKKSIQKKGQAGTEVQRPASAQPVGVYDEMDRMFDRMFESFFPRGWLRPWMPRAAISREMAPFEGRMPNVDVVDRDDEILVRAELPGVKKDDLDVSMTDNTVTIKARTEAEREEEKGDYYRCEISRGSFARTLSLPADVDGDKAKAEFKDGILQLRMPKSSASKRRSIRVE